MSKHRILRTIKIIACIPFAVMLLFALYVCFFGGLFFDEMIYGPQAAFGLIIIMLSAYAPLYVISVFVIIITSVLLKFTADNKKGASSFSLGNRSMFCDKCGAENPDSAKFCKSCGQPLEVNTVAEKPAVLSLNAIKKIIIPAAAVLLVLIAVICMASFAGREIDLTDYIVIKEVTGLNGQGELKYELDKDALMQVLLDEMSDKEITDENFESILMESLERYNSIDIALRCINVTANKAEDLSNGDIVTVTATFEDNGQYDLNYRFTNGSKTFTVSGLVDGKTVDPFAEEYVSVTFSGISTHGEANLEILSDEAPISLFTYTLSQYWNLSNGDTITLTAKVNENALLKIGYLMPETLEKTITVSGLEEGKTIDPFADEYVSVVFTGISGRGEAAIEVLSEDEPINLFYYYLSEDEYLSNGDTVTLTAKAYESDLLELGYLMPETLEKTFTVEGLGTYFDFTDGFPEEELARLCDKAMAYSVEDEEDSVFTVTVPSALHSAYSLKASDPTSPYKDTWHGREFDNAVVVVTSYSVSYGAGGGGREEWTVWVFPNYYRDSEGNLGYDEACEFGETIRKDSLEDVYVWIQEEFEVMTITEFDLSE